MYYSSLWSLLTLNSSRGKFIICKSHFYICKFSAWSCSLFICSNSTTVWCEIFRFCRLRDLKQLGNLKLCLLIFVTTFSCRWSLYNFFTTFLVLSELIYCTISLVKRITKTLMNVFYAVYDLYPNSKSILLTHGRCHYNLNTYFGSGSLLFIVCFGLFNCN